MGLDLGKLMLKFLKTPMSQENNSNYEINKLMENDSFKSIVDWNVKNRFLEKQISALSKLKQFPAISIVVFLLKTQLIEFELKQLITSLDLHLSFSNRLGDIKVKPRTPKDLDENKVTLGDLNKIIQRYEGKFLKNLQDNLNTLVKLRNDFVHKLFNLGTIKKMLYDCQEGTQITDKVITAIEKVEEYLIKNDPLKKSKS